MSPPRGPRLGADELLDQLADLIAERVAERLRTRVPTNSDTTQLYVDAKLSGLPVKTFRRAIRNGELRGFRVGREYVARAADVEAYVAKHIVKVNEPANENRADPFERAIADGRLRRLAPNRKR